MLFEMITTSIMGGLALKAFVSKNGVSKNDSGKIQRIISLSGLNVKDGKDTLTTELISANKFEWGWQYKYRMPWGREFDDYLKKQRVLQDGLNNRRKNITLDDIKQLPLNKEFLIHFQELKEKKLTNQKEIELDFDGLLIIRVYENPMPKKVQFVEGSDWKVPVGITRKQNEFKFHDFERIPHFVMGGATRYGKSNFINSLIVSLLKSKPNDVRFFFIDLKGGVELCDYENIKQCVSMAYQPEEALETLKLAYDKMIELQREVRKKGKKNVQQAGIKERYFIVIDEVGELNPSEAVDKKDIKSDGFIIHKSEKTIKEECQVYMSQIARLGAGLGFRLVLATQYPTGDVIPRQVKQNSDAKLSFRVQSETASRVVLDESGAELLPQIVGRAIYQTADKREIVQTPLITADIISETIQPYIIEGEEQDGNNQEETTHSERGTNSLVIEEI